MTESFFVGVLYYLQILKLCNKNGTHKLLAKIFQPKLLYNYMMSLKSSCRKGNHVGLLDVINNLTE